MKGKNFIFSNGWRFNLQIQLFWEVEKNIENHICFFYFLDVLFLVDVTFSYAAPVRVMAYLVMQLQGGSK